MGTERYFIDKTDLSAELVFAADHFGIATLLEVAAEKIRVFEGDDNGLTHYLAETANSYREIGTKLLRAFIKQRILDQKAFLNVPIAEGEEKFCQRCNGMLHATGLNDDCKVVWTCSECCMEWQ